MLCRIAPSSLRAVQQARRAFVMATASSTVGGSEIPDAYTLLRHACAAAVGPTGAVRSEYIDSVWDVLRRHYHSDGRHYHNMSHIDDCVRQLVSIAGFRCASTEDATLAFALLFHDIIYDPEATSGANEDRSAQMARDCISELMRTSEGSTSSDAIAAETVRLIQLTKHAANPTPADAPGCLLVDVDLSILGRSPEAFHTYDVAIRKEYAHVPEAAYRVGRAAVLRSFLDRPRIFMTEAFFEAYEQRARENLLCAVAKLTA